MTKTFMKYTFLLVLLIMLTGCSKTIEYNNGYYEGEVNLFNKPSGTGTFYWDNGETYTGSWKNGKRTGQGEITLSDGSSAKGEWLNDVITEGKYTQIIKDTEYEGFIAESVYLPLNDSYKAVDVEGIIDGIANAVAKSETLVFLDMSEYDGKYEHIISAPYSARWNLAILAEQDAIREFNGYNKITGYSLHDNDIDNNTVIIELTLQLEKEQSEKVIATAQDIVSSIIKDDMSEFEKVLTIHDYIANYVSYDHFESIEDLNDISHTAYGLFENKKAVCDGYTDTFLIMLTQVGINSYYVHGDTYNAQDDYTHIWNLVEIEDEYYHIDLTWNDIEFNNKKHGITYDYFGLSDDQLTEHVPYGGFDLIEANGEKFHYYTYMSENNLDVTLSYENATYVGKVNASGNEHGYGVMTFDDGDKYKGNFKNGVIEGYGEYYWKNGDVYKGNSKNGLRHGYGEYYWASGGSYKGNWVNGKMVE